jgi:hypothetical protein
MLLVCCAYTLLAVSAAVGSDVPPHGILNSDILHMQALPVDYPYLGEVTDFLKKEYQAKALTKGSRQMTDFVRVASLGKRTSADEISQQEARMPYGGFQLPYDKRAQVEGHVYLLCGIVEHEWISAPLGRMDPWPAWELICGKVFLPDNRKPFLVRYIVAPKAQAAVDDPKTQAVVQSAVKGLALLPRYKGAAVHNLESIIAVEKQYINQQVYGQLALSRIPADIEMYYVYFVTSDSKFGSRPGVVHATAVMTSRILSAGAKVMRQITLGEPGFTVLKTTVTLPGLSAEHFGLVLQERFQQGIAKSIGIGIAAGDIEIMSVTDLSPQLAASAAGRVLNKPMGSLTGGPAGAAGAGAYGFTAIAVTFTISQRGSGRVGGVGVGVGIGRAVGRKYVRRPCNLMDRRRRRLRLCLGRRVHTRAPPIAAHAITVTTTVIPTAPATPPAAPATPPRLQHPPCPPPSPAGRASGAGCSDLHGRSRRGAAGGRHPGDRPEADPVRDHAGAVQPHARDEGRQRCGGRADEPAGGDADGVLRGGRAADDGEGDAAG